MRKTVAIIALSIVLVASTSVFAQNLKWGGHLKPTVELNTKFDGKYTFKTNWEFGMNLSGVEGVDATLIFNYYKANVLRDVGIDVKKDDEGKVIDVILNREYATLELLALAHRSVTIDGPFLRGYPSYKVTLGNYWWDSDGNGQNEFHDGMIIEGQVLGSDIVAHYYESNKWRVEGIHFLNTNIRYDRTTSDKFNQFTYDGYQGKFQYKGWLKNQETSYWAESYFKYVLSGFAIESDLKPSIDTAKSESGKVDQYNVRVSKGHTAEVGDSNLNLWGQVGVNEWTYFYHGTVNSSLLPQATLGVGVNAGPRSEIDFDPSRGYFGIHTPEQYPYVKVYGQIHGVNYEVGADWRDILIYANANYGDAKDRVGWSKGIVEEGGMEGLKLEFRDYADKTDLKVAYGKRIGELLGLPKTHTIIATVDYQADLTEDIDPYFQKIGLNWHTQTVFRQGPLNRLKAKLNAYAWYDVLTEQAKIGFGSEHPLDNGVELKTEIRVTANKGAEGYAYDKNGKVTLTKSFNW